MHKVSAAVVEGFSRAHDATLDAIAAVHDVAVYAIERVYFGCERLGVKLYSLLVDWHVTNLRKLVQSAERKAEQLFDLSAMHRHRARELDAQALKASDHATTVQQDAAQEAAKYGEAL